MANDFRPCKQPLLPLLILLCCCAVLQALGSCLSSAPAPASQEQEQEEGTMGSCRWSWWGALALRRVVWAGSSRRRRWRRSTTSSWTCPLQEVRLVWDADQAVVASCRESVTNLLTLPQQPPAHHTSPLYPPDQKPPTHQTHLLPLLLRPPSFDSSRCGGGAAA